MNFETIKFDHTPQELFDKGDYVACLHATIQIYNIANDPKASQAALEDTGVIHELVHLACGIPTWTHRTHEELRAMLPSAMIYM